MLSGDFLRKLKKLNKNLEAHVGDNDNLPAGLYIRFYGEPIHICGIDRNYVPEFTIDDGKGHIVKAGWRRTLSILIGKHLVDKYQAQRVFGTQLKHTKRTLNIEEDTTMRAMREITQRRMEQKDGALMNKEGKLVPVYRREDFMDWREVMKQARR